MHEMKCQQSHFPFVRLINVTRGAKNYFAQSIFSNQVTHIKNLRKCKILKTKNGIFCCIELTVFKQLLSKNIIKMN
jgi:hypothetical protein